MSISIKKILCALLCLSTVSCTTMRVVPGWPASSPADSKTTGASLQVDDELLLTTRSENQMPFTVTAIDEGGLVGYSTDSSRSMRIAFDQIVKVERKEIDGLKSTLLGLGIIIIIGASVGSALPAPGL